MELLSVWCLLTSPIFMVLAWEDVPSYNDDRSGGSPSQFTLTSSGRRRPQPAESYQNRNGRDDRNQFSSQLSDSGQFPEFFRIEVEIQNLDNPSGILADGQQCDTLNACDPRISVYMDVSQPTSPWPGQVPISKWKTVFDGANRNSVNVGKVIIKDVCGGSIRAINLRAKVVDTDDTSGDDIIGQFECVYDNLTPDDVAPTLMSASWSRSTGCFPVSKNQPSSIRLTTRMRMYTIPRSTCRAERQ